MNPLLKPLLLSEQDAKELYPTASPAMKKALHNTFDKGIFFENITDRINTIEDVLEYHNLDQEDAWDDDEEADVIAYKQGKLITSAMNEGWVPNYNDTSEPKWTLYWSLNEPGFRLFDVYCGRTFSLVGSRLVFKDEKRARHAAAKFKEVYKALLT